jgi:hypothetical protein
MSTAVSLDRPLATPAAVAALVAPLVAGPGVAAQCVDHVSPATGRWVSLLITVRLHRDGVRNARAALAAARALRTAVGHALQGAGYEVRVQRMGDPARARWIYLGSDALAPVHGAQVGLWVRAAAVAS